MKKILTRLLLVVVILLVLGYFARNVVARKAVEIGAERMTGIPLEVEKMDVLVFKSQVNAQNVTLKNPKEFSEPLFIDMPQLFVDYHLPSMIAGTPHVREMLVDIKELVIVKNSKGETNVARIKGVLASGGSDTKYRVDTLRIKVGKVLYKTYTAEGRVSTKEYVADLDVTYKNLTDATQISKLVLLAVMSKVRLPDIGVPIDALKKGVDNVTNAAGKLLKEVGDVLEGAGKTVIDTGKGVFDNIKKVLPGEQKK